MKAYTEAQLEAEAAAEAGQLALSRHHVEKALAALDAERMPSDERRRIRNDIADRVDAALVRRHAATMPINARAVTITRSEDETIIDVPAPDGWNVLRVDDAGVVRYERAQGTDPPSRVGKSIRGASAHLLFVGFLAGGFAEVDPARSLAGGLLREAWALRVAKGTSSELFAQRAEAAWLLFGSAVESAHELKQKRRAK